MNTLSPEAIDYLRKMLAIQVRQQVILGRGDEPMPTPWTELHNLTIGL